MFREERSQIVGQDRQVGGLPVNTDLLFADKKGNYSPRIESKRKKLLNKVGFLADFLDDGEQIVFITTGCSPASFFEQYTLGFLWVTIIKRALFVFTNKRIFHIPTTSSYDYRGSVAQILYRDCYRLFAKGSTLHAEYHTGTKDAFFGIPRGDGAIIRQINIAAPEPAEPSPRPERSHLCPNCTHVQPAEPGTCPGCGQSFKTAAEARKYSLLFPGGGYFYVKRPLLGVLDAIGESYLGIMTLLGFVATVLGNVEAIGIVVMFSVILGLEKLMTIYHAKKFVAEFIPKAASQPRARRQEPPEEPPAPPQQRKQSLEQVLSLR